MVAKISIGSSLFGALAYNGEKINKEQGRLLATNKIFNDGSGTVDIHRAMEDFMRYMPSVMRTEKPVIHISLNPHPDDRLTDTDFQNIAHEYLEQLGYGNQPYMVYKHEDIDRHHLHIVSVNVDENGKRLNQDFLYRRSERIRKELEKKYGLIPAHRNNERLESPLRKVDISTGDVKKQVDNTVKALFKGYRFQSMGEYRALLSLYNVTVEEVRGEVRGREYHGLVYSATDDAGNKVGNPFKSSLFGKSVGYEAMEKKFAISKKAIKEKKLSDRTKRTVLSALAATYDRDKFVSTLKAQGVDVVLRETDTGRIYGATFIDHRTGCVLNGSRMGKELSANALQEHFTLPYAGEPPIPMSIPIEETEQRIISATESDDYSTGLGLFTPDGSAVDVEEERFIREMQKKKKKKRKGFRL
ncbi:conjugal transfer protein MobB [Bacteroides sp. 14(A)]|uniref:conjugal transfer protein MobB n=1 Tax=Bacteroides sp. 14(A) TaxID=1163670 RepID=UPI00047858F5|nr:conjugal transfer protein MobB [Bacteroides sp. 14(A)]